MRGFNFSVIAGAVLFFGSTLEAASIGINMAGTRGGTEAAETLAATSTAGVVPQQNFNNVGAIGTQATTLVDNNGSATTAVVASTTAANLYSTYGAAQANPDSQLLNGYFDNNGTTNSAITITGIPYATYDVYVYGNSDGGGRVGQIIVGANSFYYKTEGSGVATPGYVLTTATTAAAAPTADYARFANVTGTSLTVTISQIGVAGGSNNGITGIQIVQTPEPSVLGLAGVGGLGLLARRRRTA